MSHSKNDDSPTLADAIDEYRQGRLSRRDFVERVGALGLSLSLASVVAGKASAGALAAPSRAERSRVTAKDTLVIAVPNTPVNLDRELTSDRVAAFTIPNIMETPLDWAYRVTSDNPRVRVPDFTKLRPNMYSSWKLSRDGKTVTFRIRRGVRSYWGNELTSADFVWMAERGSSEAGGISHFIIGVMGYPVARLGKRNPGQRWVRAVDRYTVAYTVRAPNPLVVSIHTNGFGIAPWDSTEAKKHATGSDPWAVQWIKLNGGGFSAYGATSFKAGQEVVFERNENYWKAKPPIRRIVQRAVPASSNRVAALRTGAVDIAEDLVPREYSSLRNVNGVQVQQVKGNRFITIILNSKFPPLNNRLVRQALNYATPRDQIHQGGLFGFGRDTVSPVTDIFPNSVKLGPWPYDLDRARSLLQQAGFPNGFSTTLAYNGDLPLEEPIASIIQSEFRKINVRLRLEKNPAAKHSEIEYGKQRPMVFTDQLAIQPDPGYQLFLYFQSKSFINISNYNNPEVDRLLARSQSTTNQRIRFDATRRAQRLIWNDAPWIWFFHTGFLIAARSQVGGFTWDSENNYYWRSLRA